MGRILNTLGGILFWQENSKLWTAIPLPPTSATLLPRLLASTPLRLPAPWPTMLTSGPLQAVRTSLATLYGR